MNRKLMLCGMVIAGIVMSGCATKSQVREVRAEAESAKRTADQALITAQNADAKAKETEEMVNRSFKKSMRK